MIRIRVSGVPRDAPMDKAWTRQFGIVWKVRALCYVHNAGSSNKNKAKTVKATAKGAMKQDIMSYIAIAKSTKIVTIMWESERKGAEREGVWCVRVVAQ